MPPTRSVAAMGATARYFMISNLLLIFLGTSKEEAGRSGRCLLDGTLAGMTS